MTTTEMAYQILRDVYKTELKDDSIYSMRFEFPDNHNKIFLYPDLKWFLDTVFIFIGDAKVTIEKTDNVFKVVLQKENS